MHPNAITREALIEALRRRDIRPTHQRIEIAYALFSQGAHLSADQIMVRVNDRQPATSKATVYNTLNLFVAKKLIREVIVDPSKVFYDPNTEPHHHLYNVDTGELIDVAAADIAVSGLPPLPAGVVPEGIDVIVRVRARGQ